MNTDKERLKQLLVAYLYGELNEQQREEVEEYLASHASAREELAALEAVRKSLASVTDKEVIVPHAAFTAPSPGRSYHRFTTSVLAVAASVALLLLFGWLTHTRIRWTGRELYISFGHTPAQLQDTLLTARQVQNMIKLALQQHQVNTVADQAMLQQQVQSWVHAALAQQKQPAQPAEEYLRQYTDALYSENARIMRDFINQTAKEQQQAIEELLVDFARYVNQQRETDLQTLYTRINALEQNTEQYKQETDLLLTDIMTSVGQAPVKQIRY